MKTSPLLPPAEIEMKYIPVWILILKDQQRYIFSEIDSPAHRVVHSKQQSWFLNEIKILKSNISLLLPWKSLSVQWSTLQILIASWVICPPTAWKIQEDSGNSSTKRFWKYTFCIFRISTRSLIGAALLLSCPFGILDLWSERVSVFGGQASALVFLR